MPSGPAPGLSLDHVAIVAGDLEAGTRWAEARLGLAFGPGGRHPQMGTWNRLLSLGPQLYLEVIAVDPEARAPDHPRWFGLDTPPAEPRLGWVLRDPGLRHAAAHRVHALSRDALTWDFAVPLAGGAHPGLIDWGGTEPPAGRMPDSGLRLARLTVPALPGLPLVEDARVQISAEATRIAAVIETPRGPVTLS